MSCRDCTGCEQGGNLSESDALMVPADNVSSDGKFPASGNLNSAEPRESTAKLTKMHSNAVQPHARVGTVYYDEETGEAVMPGDFFGEGELRWKADPPFPKRETAPQGETAINLEQGERMPLTLEQVRKAGRFAICIDGDKAHAYCPRTEEFSTIKPVKEYEGIGIRREFAEEWFQKMFDCEMCCKKITCGAIHHADCTCARCAGSS